MPLITTRSSASARGYGVFLAAASTAFESIATYTGNSSSSVITFSSIPQTFKHLQLRMIFRGTNPSGSNGGSIMTFNGSSSNYTFHQLNGSGTAANSSGYVTGTYAGVYVGAMPADGVTANSYGVAIYDIHDYASSSKNKTVRGFTGLDYNTDGFVRQVSSVWLDTSAINSIVITQLSGWNFKTGSIVGLYGIKG